MNTVIANTIGYKSHIGLNVRIDSLGHHVVNLLKAIYRLVTIEGSWIFKSKDWPYY